MAELDPRRGQRLCVRLGQAMYRELGRQLDCRDVSAQQKGWDFVVIDKLSRRVVRRISHVTTTVEEVARALAQVIHDVRPALELALADEGVHDVWIGLHTRDLPPSKTARQEWARRLARNIRKRMGDMVGGKPAVAAAPFDDDDIEFYQCANVYPGYPGPAKVVAASDDRLTRFVPCLHDQIMPVIVKKAAKHGAAARLLTLVVEVLDGGWSENELRRGRRRIASTRGLFRSVYLARTRRDGGYGVVRYR